MNVAAFFRSGYAAVEQQMACVLRSVPTARQRRIWLAAIAVVLPSTALLAWLIGPPGSRYGFFEIWALASLLAAALILTVFEAWYGYARFRGRMWRIGLRMIAFGIVGAICGTVLIAWLPHGRDPMSFLRQAPDILLTSIAAGLVLLLLQAVTVQLRLLRLKREAERLAHEAQDEQLRRQLVESQLRALQAQIEPHFLFNTLGSAQQLAQQGAPDAARLLSQLIRFLRATLPKMREQWTTLADEAELIEAYLGIMQTRFGSRLSYAIEVPGELRQRKLPPAMLITLVENAIKHGIEPCRGGGEVRVQAGDDAGHFAVSVVDTGAGLRGPIGEGVGLANVRERLRALYGDRARLLLCAHHPQGFVARLELPHE